MSSTSERAVLSRYFHEAEPVLREASLDEAVRPPGSRPIQARPRVWWDDHVRWNEEVRTARAGRPPIPPPAPAPRASPVSPPPPPSPARAPVRIVTAPPRTRELPAEDVTPARPPALPADRRRTGVLRRMPIATLAFVFVLAGVSAWVLAPSPVRDPTTESTDPEGARSAASRTSTPSPEVAEREGVGQRAEAGAPERAGPRSARRAGRELVRRINAARADEGHPKLRLDRDLSLVAARHVDEMADRRQLTHTPDDVLGRRVTNWDVLAESIGVGPDVSALFDALMSSEADRRNLLDPALRHVGVGAERTGDRLWVTLLFTDRKDPGTTLS